MVEYLDGGRIQGSSTANPEIQGYAGGNATSTTQSAGGGGAGGTATGSGNKNGGIGKVNPIVGSTHGESSGGSYYLAGGGGGAGEASGASTGGLGGGGNGGTTNAPSSEPTSSYGGGAGGAGNSGTNYPNGASGVVILKLLTSASFSSSNATSTTTGSYTILTYTSTSSSSFTISSGTADVQYLVVAGGGASKDNWGYAGGGGAGGFRTGTKTAMTSGTYTVTVGAGGVGAGSSTTPANGGNSVFADITSLGGGGGGSWIVNSGTGFDGGSGGGAQGNSGGDDVGGSGYTTTTNEKDSITNVPENTRYEETDTRKIYRWKSTQLSPSFHYKFDESSGNVINHGSVSSADLTVSGLTRSVSTPSGIGDGMSTPSNSSADYAQNTSRVNDYKFMHDGTTKWSITFWLYPTDLPDSSTWTETMVFGNIWTDDNGIGFAVRMSYDQSPTSSSSARIQTLIADGNSGMPLNDQSPNGMIPELNAWHFYCITYDPDLSSNHLTVTRDAATSGTGFHQGSEDNNTYSSSNPTRKVTYFARPTSSYDGGMAGRLAQVMIFKDKILTQAEKVALYAGGNGTTTIALEEWKERGTA